MSCLKKFDIVKNMREYLIIMSDNIAVGFFMYRYLIVLMDQDFLPSAQMSIDFLFGMLIFMGAVAFAVQFAVTSVFPFIQTTEDTSLVAQKVSDKIMNDEQWLDTGSDGEITMENFDELQDAEGNDTALIRQLGIPPAGDTDVTRYSLNVTVVVRDGGGEKILDADGCSSKCSFGGYSAAGARGASTLTRMGYVVDDDVEKMAEVRVTVW